MGQSQGSATLTEAEVHEVSKATHYTRADIQELHETFHTKYPQGYVDHKGFKELYCSMFKSSKNFDQAAAEDYTNHMFRAYDVNGDGKISFKEFIIVMHMYSSGTAEEMLGCMFRLYDVNGDGSLSHGEIVEILTTIYKLRYKDQAHEKAKQETDKIMSRLDKNHNNKLSEQEFISAAKGCPDVLKTLKADK